MGTAEYQEGLCNSKSGESQALRAAAPTFAGIPVSSCGNDALRTPPAGDRVRTLKLRRSFHPKGDTHVPDVWMLAVQGLRKAHRQQGLQGVRKTGQGMHLRPEEVRTAGP